jgi:hypothetical protein
VKCRSHTDCATVKPREIQEPSFQGIADGLVNIPADPVCECKNILNGIAELELRVLLKWRL